MSRMLKIGILFDRATKSGREITTGILRHAATKQDWEMLLIPDHPANSGAFAPTSAELDGLIAEGVVYLNEWKSWQNVGTLALSDPPPGFKLPPNIRCASSSLDNIRLARTVADFLIGRGYSHFGFVSTPRQRSWSDEREQSFRSALRANGFALNTYRFDLQVGMPADFNRNIKNLSHWIRALPKPISILVATDYLAHHLANVCRANGLNVPEQVGIVGIDNDDLLCEMSIPPLTSVQPDFEGCGFWLAQQLDRMLQGKKPPKNPRTYGIRSIIERASTYDIKGGARMISSARTFISRNATAPITIPEIARAAQCSVRTLQKRFAAATGRTPLEELTRIRLAHVCEMLLHTHTPITEIGRLCGFSSNRRLNAVFHRQFGMSMRNYRAGKG